MFSYKQNSIFCVIETCINYDYYIVKSDILVFNCIFYHLPFNRYIDKLNVYYSFIIVKSVMTWCILKRPCVDKQIKLYLFLFIERVCSPLQFYMKSLCTYLLLIYFVFLFFPFSLLNDYFIKAINILFYRYNWCILYNIIHAVNIVFNDSHCMIFIKYRLTTLNIIRYYVDEP